MNTHLRGKRILVVDENPDEVERVRKCLSELCGECPGFFSSSSVADAGSLLRAREFDLILLDDGLSAGGGLVELRKVSDEVPVVVLTANRDSNAVSAALRDGAQDYLLKRNLDAESLGHSLRFALERQAYNRTLRKRNQQLGAIAKAVPGVLYRFQADASGNQSMPYASEKVREICGVEPEAGDARGLLERLLERVVQEDRADLDRSILRAVEGDADWHHVFRINHPRKGVRTLEGNSCFGEIDDQGNRIWNGILIDRTDEEMRRDEMRKLSLVADRTDTAVIITDPEGLTLWVNPGFERLTGFPASELIGKKPGDLLQGPDTDQEMIEFMRRKRVAGEGFEVEVLNYRAGKDPYWLHLNVQPVHDDQGKLECFVGVQTDVTERRMREDDLARKATLLETAGEIAGLGAWEYDVRSGEVIWSAGARALHEVDADFKPHIENAITFYPPEWQEKIAVYLEEAVREGKPFHFEAPFTSAKGRDRVIEAMGKPWIVDGKTLRVIGTIRDIKEERANETRLRRAKEEAEAASMAKGQFLATMSHEIRTPLNAILGLSQIIREDPEVEDRDEFLELIDKNGRMLADLITDILDFSKIESGAQEIEPEETDIVDWIAEQVFLFQESAREKDISLEWSVEEGMPRIWVFDANRLRQLVVNLIRNAVKFTEEGHVRVFVGQAPEGGILIEVSDSGIGIPEEHLESIFEDFYQVDSSNTRQFGGTGLGLSIGREIAEMMGGKIEVESAPERGSTFRARFPFEQGALQASALPESGNGGEVSAPEAADVLVAEDNEINRRVMRTMLEREGWRVAEVVDGEGALRACRKKPYPLVFMDMHMAGMDGLKATREIKADETCGNPRIVMFSASVQPSDREASFEAGADAFLAKPVNLGELRDLLARWDSPY